MAVRPTAGPVPVSVAAGPEAWASSQELRARPELEVATSPRHATVLVVAGPLPDGDREALDRTHDQLPHPRASVAWDPGTAVGEVVAAVVAADAELRRRPGEASEPDRLPDIDPNPWRGQGPHGQGGEGMMGGTPYGRAMAMTDEDRDGLALDALTVTLGPFLDPLPGGLRLEATLQGDVLTAAALRHPGLAIPAAGGAAAARRGLQWLAHALHVHGLGGHAARAAALAAELGRGADGATRASVEASLARLCRRLGRTGLWWTLAGQGELEGQGDARRRWEEALDGIAAHLSGQRAGRGADPGGGGGGAGRETGRVDPVDPVDPVDLEALGAALVGRTLDQAVVTITSLGLGTLRPVPAAREARR